LIPLYKPVKYAIGGIFTFFAYMSLDTRWYGRAGLFAALAVFMFRWAYYHDTLVPPPSKESKIIFGGLYALFSLVFLSNGETGISVLFAVISVFIFLWRHEF